MEKLVIGDIHGRFDMLNKMIEINGAEREIVFVGDVIDRGSDSYACYKLVRELCTAGQATLILGNHEQMFLDALQHRGDRFALDLYMSNGGLETIVSALPKQYYLSDILNNFYDPKLPFLTMGEFFETASNYIEFGEYLIVHAGVDQNKDNWKNSEDAFQWIRDEFFLSENTTGKKIIFGHTPTTNLHNSKENNFDIWFNREEGYLGIDGGAVFSGLLHGVIISDQDANVAELISVTQALGVEQRTLDLRIKQKIK